MTDNSTSLNKKIQSIFTKMCEENQWGIFLEKNGSKRIYSSKQYVELKTISPITPFESEEDAIKHEKRLERYEIFDLKKFLPDVDFFSSHSNYDLSIDKTKKTQILVEFLKKFPLSTLQKLEFIFGKEELKNWNNVLQIFEYLPMQQEDAKVIFKHCILNPSNRELNDISKVIPKLIPDKEQMNEAFFDFFTNHLKFFEKNIKSLQFMETFVNRHLGQYKKQYESFFSLNHDGDNDLFSSYNENFHILYLNKEKMTKNYILVFDKPTESNDYQDLLENMIGFMNKKTSKKLLKIENIYLNGHQQKNKNFIITIEKSKEFTSSLIEDFIKQSLENSVNLSRQLVNQNNTRPLKYEMVDKYDNILKQVILEQSLPEKSLKSSYKLKI